MTADDRVPSGAMLIGDEWLADTSGGIFEHVYAATGEVNATIAMAGAAEIDRAVARAADAQREWMSWTGDARRDCLLRLSDVVAAHADELTRLSVFDCAMPTAVTSAHPAQMVRFLKYYAGWIDKLAGANTPISSSNDVNLVEHEPYGVVGLIVPWNGALFAMSMALAPALAAGNAVVVKPPELAPLAALRFAELCLEAGLPPGLVNMVPGGPDAGDALVRHRGVGKIHFVGGAATARRILAAASENLTPVLTELGGKSANIVFDDADLDAAAMLGAFAGPLAATGQSCSCGSRILVHDAVYDDYRDRLLAMVANTPVGDPLDPAVFVGPVITEDACERILRVVDDAVSQKMGTVLTGGQRLGGELANGFFLAPTVFEDVSNDTPLAQVETFGPVVSLMRFSDEDQAVKIANDSDYGLVAYLQTNDLKRAHRMSRQLAAGSVWVNCMTDIVPSGPYGGYKQSGSGRVGGLEGLLEWVQVKNIRIGL